MDIQTPCYFVTPQFHAASATGFAVTDPATLAQVGVRAETSGAEIDATLAQVTAAQAQ